jgi:predicted RNA methylase
MLARVPAEVLHQAIPYLEEMARRSVADGKLADALVYYTQLIDTVPGRFDWHAQRADVYFKLDELPEAMHDARRMTEIRPDGALGHRLLAQAHEGLRERPQAVEAYRRALGLDPEDAHSRQRIQFLEAEIDKERLLQNALDPGAGKETPQVEMPPPPQITFDPLVLTQPSIPAELDSSMVEGLRQHLRRYSGSLSPRRAVARLEDPVWVSAWNAALSLTAGSTVLFQHSELGVLALAARRHGATRVVAIEPHPLDARIAGGIVQKHLLQQWQAAYGEAVRSWSEEQRRSSFEAFARGIDIVRPDSTELDTAQFDYCVFPEIDHSLLGTGLGKAVRALRSRGASQNVRMLPAKARLFAMAIEWRSAASALQLGPLSEFRWSLYPQALELAPQHWSVLSATVLLGEIDFQQFAPAHWNVQLPVLTAGRVDAIVFWYELDLGNATLSNAPGGPLECVKPAVQYTDPIEVQPGQLLPLQVDVSDTRLHITAQPPPRRTRSHQLPSWYIPMLLDQQRNDTYRAAIGEQIRRHPATSVLDIGAGFGLLSMFAAQAGAHQVTGCEVNGAFAQTARDIVKLNGLEQRIKLIDKDCRKMAVPADLPERADLAVFELFDCSLIGEGVLHLLAYAREHLLKENARYLPISARLHAMVIEYRLDKVLDVDVNLLNPYLFSPSFINVDARKLRHRALTEPCEVFTFDFATATSAPAEQELLLPAVADGTAGAVLFWFDLQVDESSWLSNSPAAAEALHWKQGLQLLPEARIARGDSLPLIARHDGSGLVFHWKRAGLPKEAFSALPRFDPRWWQQAQALEQQTHELLRHCMHDPEELKKVAQLAARFAIDPAAHDIDPVIAQRFAATFFP